MSWRPRLGSGIIPRGRRLIDRVEAEQNLPDRPLGQWNVTEEMGGFLPVAETVADNILQRLCLLGILTLKSGMKTARRVSFTWGSLLMTSATELTSLMISLAMKQPGAALPPKTKVRGASSRLGSAFSRLVDTVKNSRCRCGARIPRLEKTHGWIFRCPLVLCRSVDSIGTGPIRDLGLVDAVPVSIVASVDLHIPQLLFSIAARRDCTLIDISRNF
jgi:hypothetical protein